MNALLSRPGKSKSLVEVYLLCVALIFLPVSLLADSADWSSYNHNESGSRFNPSEKHLSVKNVSNLIEKWRFPRKGAGYKIGAIHATPTVVNGYVYFGTSTFARFYRLKPNGELDWMYTPAIGNKQQSQSKDARLLVPSLGIYSSALVTGDAVYFGDTNGVAYCLDKETGKERWKVNTRSGDFPCAHKANLLMGSPIKAGKLIIFAGGAYEHAKAQEKGYRCCNGRGFVLAFDPQNGQLVWKYLVGPVPEEFNPPLKIKTVWGERVFHYGPSTSSVWSTPSYDAKSDSVFFGTDVHNSPRKPTKEDPRNYTPHSAAVISVSASNGQEKWVSQITKGDVWNQTMPSYDPKTGYKDQSIGDTPKIVEAIIDGKKVRVVGSGSKNGGFYIMDLKSGKILANTPIYTGPPSDSPKIDARTLALPSPMGGIQSGCATDGKSFFTNGIDSIFKGTNTKKRYGPPTGGRVTSISTNTQSENWRHERPKVPWVGGTKEKPQFTNTGDPVASGIAIANGCLFFTTMSSNKLVALDKATGKVLKEIYLGPVLCGPSISRGRVYVGTGNVIFSLHPSENYFPKNVHGTLYSFGTPGADEVDKMGSGQKK
ncbi:MAG: PQQ-binding-like beta-propeller repeat protein [Akkermansiaceae bacterium]